MKTDFRDKCGGDRVASTIREVSGTFDYMFTSVYLIYFNVYKEVSLKNKRKKFEFSTILYTYAKN